MADLRDIVSAHLASLQARASTERAHAVTKDWEANWHEFGRLLRRHEEVVRSLPDRTRGKRGFLLRSAETAFLKDLRTATSAVLDCTYRLRKSLEAARPYLDEQLRRENIEISEENKRLAERLEDFETSVTQALRTAHEREDSQTARTGMPTHSGPLWKIAVWAVVAGIFWFTPLWRNANGRTTIWTPIVFALPLTALALTSQAARKYAIGCLGVLVLGTALIFFLILKMHPGWDFFSAQQAPTKELAPEQRRKVQKKTRPGQPVPNR